jgi:multidrug resistance protein MdtO
MLEFGGSREHNRAARSHLLRWQLQLRIVFLTRIALLRYILRLPGFEIPEPLLRTQEIVDGQLAERLERLAGRISNKVPSLLVTYDTHPAIQKNRRSRLSWEVPVFAHIFPSTTFQPR